MDLLVATQRIKKALSKRDYIAELTHYHFRAGEVFASNGAMTASAPVNRAKELKDVEHVVPAEEFDRALTILGSDSDMVWSTSELVVKKGRRRITIKLLQPDSVTLLQHTESRHALPPHFISGLKTIRPFLSDDATRPWALTAWLKYRQESGHVFIATNNVTVIEVRADKVGYRIDPPLDVQIPNFAIDFILEREQILQYIGVEGNKASFYFDDYSQLTTLLFHEKMPIQVEQVLDANCYDPAQSLVEPFRLTDEWKDAYRSMVQLSPEEVELRAELMTAGRRQVTMEIEVCSPVPRDTTKASSMWNPKYLTPVVEVATTIDIGSYPKPSCFYGDGIRGLTMGKFV